MPYIHFSDAEKEAANSTEIVSFLKRKGMDVKRVGNEYAWNSPTGKVSIKGSQWYSQYELVGGGAVSFVQKFFGCSYPEAVRELLGDGVGTEIIPQKKNTEKEQQIILEIPEKHSDMRRVYAYLLSERLINREVLNEFTHRGLIYEDAEHHNVVFVGKNSEGEIKHIQKRSTNSKSSYKGNVPGSDANFGFNFVGTSDKLFVFEAPIDMLAYISMFQSAWKEHSYVALCSTADCAALEMLNSHPNIKNVYLCLDHDSAGIEGAYRVAEAIHEKGNYNVWRMFPKHKDWDEDLKAMRNIDAIPASKHPKIEYINSLCDRLIDIDWENETVLINLHKSKGFLIEQVLKRLHVLEEKYDKGTSIKDKQELLFESAKVSVIASRLRSIQIGKERDWEDVILALGSAYKPHHDTSNSELQYRELKINLADVEKTFKSKGAFTKEESLSHCEMFEKYGSLCLQLYGCLEREQDQMVTTNESDIGMAM